MQAPLHFARRPAAGLNWRQDRARRDRIAAARIIVALIVLQGVTWIALEHQLAKAQASASILRQRLNDTEAELAEAQLALSSYQQAEQVRARGNTKEDQE